MIQIRDQIHSVSSSNPIRTHIHFIILYYTLHKHRCIEGLKIRLQDTLMCLYRHRFVISILPTCAGFSKNKKQEVVEKIA